MTTPEEIVYTLACMAERAEEARDVDSEDWIDLDTAFIERAYELLLEWKDHKDEP